MFICSTENESCYSIVYLVKITVKVNIIFKPFVLLLIPMNTILYNKNGFTVVSCDEENSVEIVQTILIKDLSDERNFCKRPGINSFKSKLRYACIIKNFIK